jgi:hypothetical protein
MNLEDIAHKINCHASTLKRHFPAQCRVVQLRSRRQWTSEEARAMMKRELENALADNERPPVSIVAQFLGCDLSTLRRYFPDLYRSVVAHHREAFLDGEARERAAKNAGTLC